MNYAEKLEYHKIKLEEHKIKLEEHKIKVKEYEEKFGIVKPVETLEEKIRLALIRDNIFK
tara:strand:- start:244 stop:423 length:180 start_codon:yes stop_codon:yes gene_type:complete